MRQKEQKVEKVEPPAGARSRPKWCQQQRHWLQDHARFMVLRARFEQQPWWQWPEAAARRSKAFLRQLDRDEAGAIEAEKQQVAALKHWTEQQERQSLLQELQEVQGQ